MTVWDVIGNAALFAVIFTPSVVGIIALIAGDWRGHP